MSHCPTCEHQDVVDVIDEVLVMLDDGSFDRFKSTCLDPEKTVMFAHERTALVDLVNIFLRAREMLPLLKEISKKKMELKKNASQN